MPDLISFEYRVKKRKRSQEVEDQDEPKQKKRKTKETRKKSSGSSNKKKLKHPKPSHRMISMDLSTEKRLSKFLKATIHYEKDKYGLKNAENLWQRWSKTVSNYVKEFNHQAPNEENIVNQGKLNMLNYKMKKVDGELEHLKKIEQIISTYNISKDKKLPSLDSLESQFRQNLIKDDQDPEQNEAAKKFKQYQDTLVALSDTIEHRGQQLQANLQEGESRHKDSVQNIGLPEHLKPQPGHKALEEFLSTDD